MTDRFSHTALTHPSYDLKEDVNLFFDGDLMLSKLNNFDNDSCLQSKSIHHVLKTLQNDVKSKFDIIYSDIRSHLAIPLLGGKRYFITFIDEFI
jgi:hypothetical protein